MNLREIILRPVIACEEARFRALLDTHHYLGSLPKIGHTLWYVATWQDRWLGLLSVGAPAWKCAARDRWIGWDLRHQYDRLHLIANNARFLILPEHHYPNLASRILSLCERRLPQDWTERFGHPVWLLETFVDLRWSSENGHPVKLHWPAGRFSQTHPDSGSPGMNAGAGCCRTS